jgi:hypothetical protein
MGGIAYTEEIPDMKKHLAIASLLSLICTSFAGISPVSAAPNDTLVKGGTSSVYYLHNGMRYVFPYENVFFSWFSDFSSVVTISDAELVTYPLKKNVTYQPGKWMVKIVTDPKVYVVGRYGTLHWVTSESLATQLYGSNWNQMVRDVPDAFFENYVIGDPITSANQFVPQQETSGSTMQAALDWDVRTQTPTPLPSPSAPTAPTPPTSPTPTAPTTPTPTTPSSPVSVSTSCVPGSGTDYQVGPNAGQLTSLSQVPWETLKAGDTVRIFYRAAPYRGKFLLTAHGTASAPVRVCGVKGPNGERPIVTGDGAVTRTALVYGSSYSAPIQESRSVVMIKGSAAEWTDVPTYIQIDGLAIRGAHPSYSFTDTHGATQAYTDFGACVWVDRGHNITIADNEISDCSQGIFTKSTDDGSFAVTKDIRIAGNDIHGNGIAGSDRMHNTYTQSVGIVYEYNTIGAERSGAGGNAIKDRSVGTVIRFNRIEEGAHAMDLVESEDFPTIATADPAYRKTYVYGNQIKKNGGTGSFIHYGGDHVGSTQSTWGEPIFRKGTLYFWNNSVIVTGNSGALFQLSTTEETAQVWNNIFYFSPSVTQLSMRANQEVGGGYTAGGILNLGVNWINTNWSDSDQWHPVPGQLHGTSNLITGSVAPINTTTFVPVTTQVVDVAQANLSAVSAYPVNMQLLNGVSMTRSVVGSAADLGAVEYVSGALSSVSQTTTPVAQSTPTTTPTPTTTTSPSTTPTSEPTTIPTPTPTSGAFISFADFPNGTNVNSTASDWGGTGQFEVVGGTLQTVAGRGSYGEYSFRTGMPGANQGIEIVRKGGAFSGSLATLLHAGYAGNYSSGRYTATWNADYIDLRSDNGTINYHIPISVNWNADATLKMTIQSGVLKLFANGTEVYSYTDPNPLSGGYPGFSLVPGSDVTAQRLVSVRVNS